MKTFMCMFFTALLLVTAACSEARPALEKSPYGAADALSGITMTINAGAVAAQDDTAKLVIENRTKREYIFGAAYDIEQECEEEWYALPDEDRAWPDIGYILHAGGTWIEEISLPEKLEPGSYRIVKAFWFEDGTNGFVFGAFAVE